MARKFGKGSEKGEMDFELNIASIIDCFTVLITYLLVSASFISLGVLDVTVAVPAMAQESAPNNEPPKLTVNIELATGEQLVVRTTGAETKDYPIPARNGAWDFEAMTGYLKELKGRYPAFDSAMVSADDRIEYKDVVKTVQAARETLPNVALGTDQIGQWAP
jgi:biopolymer transport protein ExbD